MIYFSRSDNAFFDSALMKSMPKDVVPVTPEEHRILLAGQASGRKIIADENGRATLAPACPGPDYVWDGSAWIMDVERREARAISLIQFHMDAKARQYGYGGILSAVSYAGSSQTKWREEGAAFSRWRDDVWLCGLALLADVEPKADKTINDEELIAALPAFPLDIVK